MALPLNEWLWRHEYWLPPGITWEDMKETEEIRYPQPRHLLLSVPFALLLVAIRFVFERLSKQCDLQPRQVERWFRYRHNWDRPSLTKKFCEASWRFTFYVTSFCTGVATLYNPASWWLGLKSVQLFFRPCVFLQKPWFWDHRECWVGYPQQAFLPPPLSPFQDFHEQIVHHAATIFLISFSYCANYIRIGTLVMIIHDAPDCILEPTKIFNYLKWRRICDALFLTFSALFLLTRLVIFPYKVLYNTYYYSMEIFQPFFGYYFMNALLMTLQLLHIFWSCLIIHMVYKFMKCGTMEKDLRSDTEDSEKDEDETGQREKEAKSNGSVHSEPSSNGNCVCKEMPLRLNGRTFPANGHTKTR
ncbi:hypothetical protein JD844_034392 [Phrynosoma platyrhinos]|uniref:TLC domain-containing protein n=1 Tax=Phrynosoma platyrhinos TaxID=52577 RepID=A0ABQ7T8P7_PHRPL|nr:hypothetical protein JD844_034392 [Phrynosoma platyrhinos]